MHVSPERSFPFEHRQSFPDWATISAARAALLTLLLAIAWVGAVVSIDRAAVPKSRITDNAKPADDLFGP